MTEFDEKRERLQRVCHDAGVAGVILATQASFAWFTGGRSNRIDGSRELGAGALLVTADGAAYVLANTIEMPRLMGEELAGFAFTPIEYPWSSDHSAPDTQSRLAQQVLGAGSRIGADWPLAGTTPVDVTRARLPLTAAEVDRYRKLGRDVALALEQVCRQLQPGMSEHEVSRRAVDSALSVGARAVVSLVAADDRIARFRHPVPAGATWQRTLLVAQVSQRHGLCVSMSRLLSAGPVADDLATRTRAAATVFEALLDATRPGARGADLFAAGAAAYARVGFSGEEQKHHQGGAAGYRSRDWIAHAASQELVHAPQAFAWNPTITGTKVEDTALVSEDGVELMTATGGWPTIPIEVRGRMLGAAGILELS